MIVRSSTLNLMLPISVLISTLIIKPIFFVLDQILNNMYFDKEVERNNYKLHQQQLMQCATAENLIHFHLSFDSSRIWFTVQYFCIPTMCLYQISIEFNFHPWFLRAPGNLSWEDNVIVLPFPPTVQSMAVLCKLRLCHQTCQHH